MKLKFQVTGFQDLSCGGLESVAAGGTEGLRSSDNQQMLTEGRYFCLLIIIESFDCLHGHLHSFAFPIVSHKKVSAWKIKLIGSVQFDEN